MSIKALLALPILLVLLPASAAAQGIAGSLHELRLLVRPGETITVIDPSGNEVKGRIESLSSSQLVLATPSGPRSWGDRDVLSIRQRRSDSLANGAWIGLGTGAAIGVAGALAIRETGADDAVFWVGAFYGGIGAGIGAGIDALVRSEYVIFQRAAAPPVAVRVSPLVTAKARGVQVAVSF